MTVCVWYMAGCSVQPPLLPLQRPHRKSWQAVQYPGLTFRQRHSPGEPAIRLEIRRAGHFDGRWHSRHHEASVRRVGHLVRRRAALNDQKKCQAVQLTYFPDIHSFAPFHPVAHPRVVPVLPVTLRCAYSCLLCVLCCGAGNSWITMLVHNWTDQLIKSDFREFPFRVESFRFWKLSTKWTVCFGLSVGLGEALSETSNNNCSFSRTEKYSLWFKRCFQWNFALIFCQPI